MIEIKPSIDEIKNIINNSDKKCIIPIWCEIIADLETPVSAYHKVCNDKKYGFLLESVEGGENIGRYSFIGIDPLYILKSDGYESVISSFIDDEIFMKDKSPYCLMEKFLSNYTSFDFDLPFSPGIVGYLGYDSIRHIEPVLNKYFEKIEECSSFPEAYFMIAGSVLAFDHVKHKIYIINNIIADKNTDIASLYSNSESKLNEILANLTKGHNLSPLNLSGKESNQEISSNMTKEEWIDSINAAKEHIKAGDIFQVVLSQRFCVDRDNLDPLEIYRALRSINPSPYLYYLNFNGFQIVGSSPEALVKCSKDRIVSTRPIAGTRKRGADAQEDERLKKELLADPKERAEHIMLVDLARNDIGKVSKYGSVKVNRLMDVEYFSHVMHIVSDVTGELADKYSSIDLLKGCFPAGTVSGAPKIRAMEIIYNLEKSARGPYAGCVGYIGFNNEVNTAITLRTMLVRGDKIFIQAGAGIVADSDPELEYNETQSKAAALIQALAKLKE